MTETAVTGEATLQGLSILVVEDEYMIAEEVAEALVDAGATPVGPVPSVGDALSLIAATHLDGALLDVNVNGEAIWPVVDALVAGHVPLVLATGYDASAIPPAYARLPRREKPIGGADLVVELVRELSKAPSRWT